MVRCESTCRSWEQTTWNECLCHRQALEEHVPQQRVILPGSPLSHTACLPTSRAKHLLLGCLQATVWGWTSKANAERLLQTTAPTINFYRLSGSISCWAQPAVEMKAQSQIDITEPVQMLFIKEMPGLQGKQKGAS